MVLISEIKDIEEFRGIKKLKEPIKLSKLTVLVGRNNSAKTTILEALSLFPLHYIASKITGRDRIGAIMNLHKITKKEGLIYRYTGNAKIEVLFANRNLAINLPTGTIVTPEGVLSGLPTEEVIRRLGVSQDEASTDPDNYTLYIPHNDEFLFEVQRFVYNNWEKIEKVNAHVSVVRDVIAKCVDDRLTEILPRFEELMVRKEFTDETPAYIRIYDMGLGIEKVISILLYLEAMKPRVVLWDDFEVASHPSLISKVLEWLATRNWQVVISTHSIDTLSILSDLAEERKISFKVILLRKNINDELYHKELTASEVVDMFYANQDIRKLVDSVSL
jgi:ABC-type polar amino acid transport system ATPase subunit